MIRLPRRLVLVALVGALTGCDPEKSGADTGPSATEGIDCSSRQPALDYDNYGQAFMVENCAGCHSSLLPVQLREGAPPGVELNTYADVVFWVERIEARALSAEPDMPPGGGLTEDDRGMLAEWLACQVYPDAERVREQENQ